jgi:hypothetical protein
LIDLDLELDSRIADAIAAAKPAIIAETLAAIPAAPAVILDPYRPRCPHDMDPRAVPSETFPGAAIADATTQAINKLGAEQVEQRLLGGVYHLAATVSPSGGSRDRGDSRRQVHFNGTTLRAVPTADISAYTEITGQDTSGQTLAGLDDPSDNLPAGITTRVMYDLWNTDRTDYSGTVNFIGLEQPGFCILASANRYGEDAAGGIGSTWENVSLSNYWCAMFGTPRYGGARNFYSGAFVGNKFGTVKINPSGPYTIIAGGNTLDDTFFDTLKIANGPGARAYITKCNINVGSLYANGRSKNDYIFDLQRTALNFGTFYAEGELAAPILMRNGSFVKGICRYGAGTTTDFGRGAFIHDVSVDGGGRLECHPDCAGAGSMRSLVLLKAISNARRVYDVMQTYQEGVKLPFNVEGDLNPKVTLPASDQIHSLSPSGRARWAWSGTAALPAMTRIA